jgi:SAM-dependent methyltransferase
MERDEKALWNQKYREGSHSWLTPDPFLESAYSEFLAGVTPGKALDVAGGAGRHALWLAQRGWQVKLVDISDVGVKIAQERFSAQPGAAVVHGSLETQVMDLNSVRDFGREQYDLILVFFFLQRELFPALIAALKPGGFLIYRTYTIEQQKFKGGPSHPMHLLQPNELLRAFAELRVLHYRETAREKAVAEFIGQKFLAVGS